MHSFHCTIVIVYIFTIADLSSSAASIIFPVHRPLIYYSLRWSRGHCGMSLSLLWEQCIAAYLREVFTAHSGSEGTVKSYASVLRGFFRHTNKAPELCTREDVVSFMAASNHGHRNHGLPPSPGTRLYRKTVIHQLYVFAARYTCYDGYGRPYKLYQGENPAAGLRYAPDDPRPEYLTAEEITRFFSAIPRDTAIGLRDYSYFLVLFLTARRRSEIANLLWGDITFGTITDEHGTRQGHLFKFKGKGRQAFDQAELPEPAYHSIMRWLEASGRGAAIEADDPVYVAVGPRYGGGPRDPYARLSGSSIQRAVKKYARLAGLEKRVHVHIFRHSSAKHRLDNGESIFSLKETLRHKSLDQAYRYARSLQTPADNGAALLMQQFADL